MQEDRINNTMLHHSTDITTNSDIADEEKTFVPDADIYDGHNLIQSMIKEEATRMEALDKNGRMIRESVKGNQAWFRTIFVLQERALDRIMIPLAVCTINSLVWQVLSYAGVLERIINVAAGFHSASVFVQTNVVSTALGFLLVFRLNRASVRWWECRTMWGMVIAYIRVLASGISEHLSHSPKRRDQAVAWTAAFAVASKQMLRGETDISQAELAGVLSSDDVMRLQLAKHPPLYCCEEIRHAIQRAFPKGCCKDHAHSGDNVSAAIAQSAIIRSLESSIDALIINIGGMERIRVTPLPMVYVSHLRTFLLLYLLLLPYMIGESWGYFTVPTVFITSFSLLGIDGAAAECESPFQRSRVNHLDMDTFCQTAFKSVLQILIHAAERERREVFISES